MTDTPWVDRRKWEASAMVDKDRVTVVIDEDFGAIAGNWRDGELVATGADGSAIHPCKMPDGVPLATVIAHSHLSDDARMPAIEWLLEHEAVVSDEHMAQLEAWYAQGGGR